MNKAYVDSMDPIYIDIYTRAQAIEDGCLIDVSEEARKVGFDLPVAITIAVWSVLSDIPRERNESAIKRLQVALRMAEIKKGYFISRCDELEFLYTVALCHGNESLCTLKLCKHPGDNGEPVITIMLPMED